MTDSARRLEYLRAIGVDVWVRREAAQGETRGAAPDETRDARRETPNARQESPAVQASDRVARPASRVSTVSVDSLDWPSLEAAVKGCTLCDLNRTRTQTVFGVGDRRAQWMIVGEAPGADEDAQGEPFVGRAGQLLNSMLKAIGLQREQVFIANVMKCRPPQNRDPTPAEAACCKPYLHRQIDLVNPKLILCVGRIAAQNLLETDTPIGKLRGQVHRLGKMQRPVVVTYHPAYLLRSPGEKRRAWEDLILAMAEFDRCRGSNA
jgi:uracil-DNA glycosylase family 4